MSYIAYNAHMKRVLFDIIIFFSLFALPWWATAIFAFVGMFVFPQFFEFIAVWVIIYAMHAIAGPQIITSPVWFPVIVCTIFAFVQILRQHIILYKNEISY